MNRIKQLRKTKGLTLDELSKELKKKYGLSLSTGQLSSYENSKRLPREEIAWEIIADFFGVSTGYLLGFDSVLVNNGITDLIAKINEWAISHGLDKGNPKIEWMKVTEEVGEIRDVFLKPNDFDDPELALKDAIGDSIVTLVVLCLQLGYDVEECLKIAYNNIKDRQGVMIDDNFVKKTKTR
ncbi:DNA binding protein [Streptococcus phage 01205]|uniref:ORF20 n=1 Tax=Streptococcus phage O1205 TaxID=85154 RepID=O34051_BPO12|nr:DNA binding protein [Streptococcus phage 01205]AAC79536.1 ORF20 [Streptococcus phage 01205]